MTDFGLDTQTDHEYANTKGWIVSIATAGAVFGCLGVGIGWLYKDTIADTADSACRSMIDLAAASRYGLQQWCILLEFSGKDFAVAIFLVFMHPDSFLELASVRRLSFRQSISQRY
jgi:hypothetical protein